MGFSKPRSSGKKGRRPAARKGRSAKARRGNTSFLRIWIWVVIIFAVMGMIYLLWPQRPGRTPEGPKKEGRRALPPRQMSVTLYFSDQQAEYLVGETRRLPWTGGPSQQAREVIKALISGPRSGLQPTIPEGTRLRDVHLRDDGLCVVDFTEEFRKNHPGGSSGELMTVYSIVESLSENVRGVRSVQILVEGRTLETLAGHLSIASPLKPDSRYLRSKRRAGSREGTR